VVTDQEQLLAMTAPTQAASHAADLTWGVNSKKS